MAAGDPTRIHILTIDYRGFGYSTGTPTEQGLITDGIALVKFALEIAKIPPERIVIHGHSLGSAVSIGVAEYFSIEQSIDFKSIVLVSSFSDLPTLMSTYSIGGIVPILSPLRPYPFLQRFFADHIQEKWLTAQRLVNTIKTSKRFNLNLIHARNDFEIPWSHSDTLFYVAANATSDNGMSVRTIDAVKTHQDLGTVGWINTWFTGQQDGGRKTIRQEIVSFGGIINAAS